MSPLLLLLLAVEFYHPDKMVCGLPPSVSVTFAGPPEEVYDLVRGACLPHPTWVTAQLQQVFTRTSVAYCVDAESNARVCRPEPIVTSGETALWGASQWETRTNTLLPVYTRGPSTCHPWACALGCCQEGRPATCEPWSGTIWDCRRTRSFGGLLGSFCFSTSGECP